ncbi:BON domain protein [Rosistilla carotiformis]|uniref:BON domain protein n=1 Tax=Rosistilla carotiformis TaxID=2528017 RepID=A0A518JM24_9BACT|nr:BON domain-containing protein [Rosistilla carotiformis]QDV66599.1 BON domain protein [Rosistilla carotiformis]
MITETFATQIDNEPLQIRVDSVIRQHPHLRGMGIRPHAEGQNVVLSGTVRSYFIKQMAQEAVRSVPGADRVDNQIEVHW